MARYVVVTDVNRFRIELASRMGARLILDVNRHQIAEVRKQFGMHDGFGVGLEMSGNPAVRSSGIYG